MPIERVVGLFITDPDAYREYRRHARPIFERYGGQFILDVEVSAVLSAPEGAAINRLFTFRFPDEASHDAFFCDPEYLAVREVFFVPCVASITPIARYHVAP